LSNYRMILVLVYIQFSLTAVELANNTHPQLIQQVLRWENSLQVQ
jgi:hypothetical protein